MFKELVFTLIYVIAFSSAARVPHREPVKKQAVYPGYVPQYNNYQDSSYYGGAQGQNQFANDVSTGANSLKQSVPQKAPTYAVNSIPNQYPFKQYYPQIYPQNSYYPSVPSVFYAPSQAGRFPVGANEGTLQAANVGNSGNADGGSFGSIPQFPSSANGPQFPSAPSFPSQLPQFPSQFPQFPSQFPQFPSQFPQFPSQFPQFPSNFPSGNFPAFPANPVSPPTGASPGFVSGGSAGEAVPGATTNAEGNSIVVVGARRPEKIENADSSTDASKSDAESIATRFPAQQYVLLSQPQYVGQASPQPNADHISALSNGKDQVQLDSATKGAISNFLIQPQSSSSPVSQQSLIAQPTPIAQFPQTSRNKILSAQDFQQLLQQSQAALPQFYAQQGVVQQGVAQPNVNPQIYSQNISPQQLQDISSHQEPGFAQQQFLYPTVQPVAQSQQPILQFSPQQQQQFQQYFPQFVSLPQPKPSSEGIANVPGASLAYQRFILENQKPIQSSVVGAQNLEAPTSVPTSVPISVQPSVPPSVASSPEPTRNSENDSAGNTSGSAN